MLYNNYLQKITNKKRKRSLNKKSIEEMTISMLKGYTFT